MLPSLIAKLIKDVARSGSIDEWADRLSFSVEFRGQSEFGQIESLRDNLPAFLVKTVIAESDSDGELLQGNAPVIGQVYRVTLMKLKQEAHLFLFFGKSLKARAADIERSHHVCVADMGENSTFTTWHARYQLWTSDQVEPYSAAECLPDPRRFSLDFTGKAFTPDDIRHWLLSSAPSETSDAYETWIELTSSRLMASVANSVSLESGRMCYGLQGPPFRKVIASDSQLVPLFERLTDGARWVYSENKDAETRHTFLSMEWARSYAEGDLSEFGNNSLESAKTGYNAHVKAGSRETLKALAELRQNVITESQGTAERTQLLAAGLWKDLAIASVPFFIQLFKNATSTVNEWIAGGSAIAAAVFLIASFSMQVHINDKYFERQKQTRESWKTALRTALTQSEIENLEGTSITDADIHYRGVRRVVFLLYLSLVIVLGIFAYYSLEPIWPETWTFDAIWPADTNQSTSDTVPDTG